MWEHKYAPQWWRDRVLCPAPKSSDASSLTNMRPISLFEILRKLWTGIIITRIHYTWATFGVLHSSQHGYRWRQGTDTALLRLINALEEGADQLQRSYLTLWDIRRCFDSISRNLMKLAWARLGVPADVVQWITTLDEGSHTYIWSPYMADNMEPRSLDSLLSHDGPFIREHELGFDTQRGCGQGDTLSSVAFVAVFDILLDWIDPEITNQDLAYADDLSNVVATQAAMQERADRISAFCSFSGLEIAATKIISVLVSPDPDDDPPDIPLIVRDWHWHPSEVHLQTGRQILKYLRVEVCLEEDTPLAYKNCKAYLQAALGHITIRQATPACKMEVITRQILPKIVYKASKASWSLAQYERFDRLFAATYRTILRLGHGFPAALTYMPRSMHGLGLPRFSDVCQNQKWSALCRAISLG